MNLNDPLNIFLTIPEGFDFDLGEYEKATGCKIDPIEVPSTLVNDLVKMVLKKHEDKGIPVKIISWSPLLFSKTIRLFSGKELTEKFSLMTLRIKGKLQDDSVKRIVCDKLHSIGDSKPTNSRRGDKR